MFEKIAQAAFNDEMNKIAINMGSAGVAGFNRIRALNKLSKSAPVIKKPGFAKSILGALGLSALSFGAGSAMAASSGAGTGNEY